MALWKRIIKFSKRKYNMGCIFYYRQYTLCTLVRIIRKLNKLVAETGEEWPSKLQATVLAANTIWKKSIKFTPFCLMYGPEANCAHLLELNRN